MKIHNTSITIWYHIQQFGPSYDHSFIHSWMALQPFFGPWPLLQFRNLFYTDGRTPWTSDQTVTRPLPTHRTTQTQNKHTHKYPCLECESNPRSQRPSERRQFMPQTARPVIGTLRPHDVETAVIYELYVASISVRWLCDVMVLSRI
jgi:hypothetical protein